MSTAPANITHISDSQRHTFHVQFLENPSPQLILTTEQFFDGKLIAVIDLHWTINEEPSLLRHLAQHLHDHPIFSTIEWMIQLLPKTNALYTAMIAAGWRITKQKHLYRKAIDQTPVAATQPYDLRIVPASSISNQDFAALFHACNQGNPDEPNIHAEPPEAFLQRWRTELGDLHDPSLAHILHLASHPIGVLLLRTETTPSRHLGFINFIGIHPAYRNRGLGTSAHRIAIQHLGALGCTHYIGSTQDTNHAMRELFLRNAIPETGKQVFLRTTAHCPH